MSQPAADPGVGADAHDDSLYGPYYFMHNCGVPYADNEHWREFFGALADKLIARYRPKTLLDAGCAWGFLVRALRQRGVEAYGLDVSKFAISQVPDEVADYCWEGSLLDPLPERYDLVVCIEVIEHLGAADGEVALRNICNSTDRLVLSSTPDDYGEATHLNVQQPDYWASMLAELGFVHDLDGDELSPLPHWAAVFERVPVTAPNLVRRYERRLWGARQEVAAVRANIMGLEAELESDRSDADRLEETEAEIVRLREEQLRLREDLLNARDAVIGHEAALGEALGRLRANEHVVNRYRDAADRLDAVLSSQSWRLTQKALSPYRRLRGFVGR